MSLATAVARIAELNSLLPAPAVVLPITAPQAQPGASFASQLQAATATSGAKTGDGMVNLARGEVGQREAPMGSNDSPRIAEYRSAVPGGPVGPWCAYFASWVAKPRSTVSVGWSVRVWK